MQWTCDKYKKKDVGFQRNVCKMNCYRVHRVRGINTPTCLVIMYVNHANRPSALVTKVVTRRAENVIYFQFSRIFFLSKNIKYFNPFLNDTLIYKHKFWQGKNFIWEKCLPTNISCDSFIVTLRSRGSCTLVKINKTDAVITLCGVWKKKKRNHNLSQ